MVNELESRTVKLGHYRIIGALAMLKRIATFLLGIALVSLGVLFFIAPERTVVVQLLLRYWPVFLILAGLVRVGGHLLDRQPRSPMGGMLLTAIGGILLTANLRGESGVLEVIGRYWFWLLLAFVAARVIKQYRYQSTGSAAPRAFSPLAIVVMLLIAGAGLGSYWLNKNGQKLSRLRLPFSISNVRGIFNSEFSIADEAAKTFALTAKPRLVFDGFDGDIEIRSGDVRSPSARLVRRIRASSEDEAKAIAQRISLDIRSQGESSLFSIIADTAADTFDVALSIEMPKGVVAAIDAGSVLGEIKLTGLKGDHSLRDVNQVTVGDNLGRITIEGGRAIQLNGIAGSVTLKRVSRDLSLRQIIGAINIDMAGGNGRIENASGPDTIEGKNARLELRDIAQGEGSMPALVDLKNLSDSRINIGRVRGTVRVVAVRSKIDAGEINGDLTAASSSERILVSGVTGTLKLIAEDGSVEAADLQGPAEIEATREATVRGFRSSLAVATRLGAITLALDQSPGADVHAVSEHGIVRLNLPEDSRFRLDAMTSFGRLKLRGFASLDFPRGRRTTSISYTQDPSFPLLTLRSTNGDIVISSSRSRENRASN